MPNWNKVVEEVSQAQARDKEAYDTVRRKYLEKLHEYTGRNIIAYYSGFLAKRDIQGTYITDEDKNGFMACVHEMDRKKGLDLFLHTPGGEIAATESLVHYLREMFDNNIRAVVPQIAMSAGTMIACSCDSILMGMHSNIGPVDPQFSGMPAIGIIQEVKRALDEIKEDERAVHVWSPILSNLEPSFIQRCDWAIERSKEFLVDTLNIGMLRDLPDSEKARRSESIINRLTNLAQNKAHDRHIHYQECKEMGLTIESLEEDRKLQDLVLTVHHCFMYTLSNTAIIKIIEDHRGRTIVKMNK